VPEGLRDQFFKGEVLVQGDYVQATLIMEDGRTHSLSFTSDHFQYGTVGLRGYKCPALFDSIEITALPGEEEEEIEHAFLKEIPKHPSHQELVDQVHEELLHAGGRSENADLHEEKYNNEQEEEDYSDKRSDQEILKAAIQLVQENDAVLGEIASFEELNQVYREAWAARAASEAALAALAAEAEEGLRAFRDFADQHQQKVEASLAAMEDRIDARSAELLEGALHAWRTPFYMLGFVWATCTCYLYRGVISIDRKSKRGIL